MIAGGDAVKVRHRGDHAVVLLPGAAAAEEGDEEDHHPHPDDDDGHARGRGVLHLVGVVQTDLDQDADHDQGEAAQLQGRRRGVRLWVPVSAAGHMRFPKLTYDELSKSGKSANDSFK